MNTAVTIADTISSTVLWLAGIGAGLKIALAVAPRFQIAAPKAPVQPKGKDEADAAKPPAAGEANAGPVPLENVA